MSKSDNREAILRRRRIKEDRTRQALEQLVGGTITGWRFDTGPANPSGVPVLEVKRDDNRDVDLFVLARQDGGCGHVSAATYDKEGRR